MRPNLMSPRRPTTSGEDSILAMLEREPTRKRGKGASGARLAWYGAGTGLVVALTGALVWLAANNDGRRPEAAETVLAEAVQAPPPAAAPVPSGAAVVRQVAMAPLAAEPEPRSASAALIVDQVDMPAPAAPVPPLRLLKPAPEKTVAPLTAPLTAPAPAAAPATAAATPARPSRPAASTLLAAKAPARAATAAAPARPRPVMVAKNPVRPGQPKAQRGAAPARPAEGAVDADVALISAVIVHANGHAPENSQMTELLCPNDNCQPRPPRQ